MSVNSFLICLQNPRFKNIKGPDRSYSLPGIWIQNEQICILLLKDVPEDRKYCYFPRKPGNIATFSKTINRGLGRKPGFLENFVAFIQIFRAFNCQGHLLAIKHWLVCVSYIDKGYFRVLLQANIDKGYFSVLLQANINKGYF